MFRRKNEFFYFFVKNKNNMNHIDFSYHDLSLHVINHTLDNWEQKEEIHAISFRGNSFTEKVDIIHLFENILSQFPNLYSLDFCSIVFKKDCNFNFNVFLAYDTFSSKVTKIYVL